MKITDNDNGSIFSVFSGLDKFINIVSDMVESEKNEVNISGDMKPDNENKISGRYGFNIKLGPESAGGAPADQAFNNLFVRKDGAPKTVEPVTDVFEEENSATIVAELPGVEKGRYRNEPRREHDNAVRREKRRQLPLKKSR